MEEEEQEEQVDAAANNNNDADIEESNVPSTKTMTRSGRSIVRPARYQVAGAAKEIEDAEWAYCLRMKDEVVCAGVTDIQYPMSIHQA